MFLVGRDGEEFDCVVVMDDVDGSFKTPGYPAPYDPDIGKHKFHIYIYGEESLIYTILQYLIQNKDN